jgi:hypothetical protein
MLLETDNNNASGTLKAEGELEYGISLLNISFK